MGLTPASWEGKWESCSCWQKSILPCYAYQEEDKGASLLMRTAALLGVGCRDCTFPSAPLWVGCAAGCYTVSITHERTQTIQVLLIPGEGAFQFLSNLSLVVLSPIRFVFIQPVSKHLSGMPSLEFPFLSIVPCHHCSTVGWKWQAIRPLICGQRPRMWTLTSFSVGPAGPPV